MTARPAFLPVLAVVFAACRCGEPGVAALPDAADSVSPVDGGEVATPSFTFTPPEALSPCGDWEPAEVTMPREVPPGIDGLSLKWSFELGIFAGPRWWGIALSPTGAICAPVAGGLAVGCISPGGLLEWSEWTSGTHGHDVVGSLVVTPDGHVLAQTEFRELRLFRAYAPTIDSPLGRILWQKGARIPDGPMLPEGELMPAAFVAADGYLFNAGPHDRDLTLLDRCGQVRWTLRGLVLRLTGFEAGVLGSELLAMGWPEGTMPTAEPDGNWRGMHLYAIHHEGRLRELPLIPTRWRGVAALGGGHAMLLEWVLAGDGRPAGAEKWLFDASGEILEHAMLASPVSASRSTAWLIGTDGSVFLGFDELEDGTGDGLVVKYGEADTVETVARGRGLGFQGFILGRDGRLLAFGNERVTADARETDVTLIGPSGSIEDVLTVPVVGVRGVAAILAEDGTLYLTGIAPAGIAYLVAVQTPVGGYPPEEFGWTRLSGRNSRGDGWAR
jgi:hypothetical protein